MNTRLLLGIMPLGGAAVAAFIVASQNRQRPEPELPELPEHRTLRLLGHEVEVLTNRLRDLMTRTPDVQQLIVDVGELRGDVRRLAGEVEAYRVERTTAERESAGQEVRDGRLEERQQKGE